MVKFEYVCGSCVGIAGAILLLACIGLTNTYAEEYEGGSGLAEYAGRYLLGGIFLVVIAMGGCAGCAGSIHPKLAIVCAVCLGVVVSILAMISGILVAVSAARNSSNEGTNWGAAAATFNFLTMFTPWCTFWGVLLCLAPCV